MNKTQTKNRAAIKIPIAATIRFIFLLIAIISKAQKGL